MADGPLAGIKVLEFTQIIAGPVCGVTLSDLGADVIKIEPIEGDPTRRLGSVVPGESKGFQSFNRGKRSISVDLRSDAGRALVYRLVDQADALITNYRLGVPERLGIDYETLSKRRPSLVYWHGTAFGADGPEAHRSGTDLVAQAYAGLLAGDEKIDEWGAPVRITCAPFADYMTGVAGALAVTAALHHRALTGEGQKVGSSLLQSAIYMQMPYVAREPVTDAILRDPMLAEVNAVRQRHGTYAEIVEARSHHSRFSAAYSIYYGGFQARDGALVMGATTKANRDAARRVLGVEEEDSDGPEYDANAPDSKEKAERWKAIVRERLLTRDVADWLADFDRAGVPASGVQLPEEVSEDPHVIATGMMAHLEHEVTGPQQQAGPLVTLSRTPAEARRPSPPLGRHTDEVLREFGVTDDELEKLHADGTVN